MSSKKETKHDVSAPLSKDQLSLFNTVVNSKLSQEEKIEQLRYIIFRLFRYYRESQEKMAGIDKQIARVDASSEEMKKKIAECSEQSLKYKRLAVLYDEREKSYMEDRKLILQESAEEKKKLLEHFSEGFESLQTQLEQYSSSNDMLRKENTELKKKIEDTLTMIQNSQAKYADVHKGLLSINTGLENDLNKALKENIALKLKLKDADTINSVVQEYRDMAVKQGHTIELYSQQNKKLEDALKEQIDIRQKREELLLKQDKTFKRVQSNFVEKDKEIERLKKQVSVLQKVSTGLQDRLKAKYPDNPAMYAVAIPSVEEEKEDTQDTNTNDTTITNDNNDNTTTNDNNTNNNTSDNNNANESNNKKTNKKNNNKKNNKNLKGEDNDISISNASTPCIDKVSPTESVSSATSPLVCSPRDGASPIVTDINTTSDIINANDNNYGDNSFNANRKEGREEEDEEGERRRIIDIDDQVEFIVNDSDDDDMFNNDSVPDIQEEIHE
ncbi:hypothetical protein WA158_001065 [Blastocystis sp. Blastoise]